MGKFKDLTGMEFGRLAVIERAIEFEQERLKQGKRKDTYWICECSCGNKDIKPKRSADLTSGKVLSCGCVRNEAIRVYASNMSSGGNSILDYILENDILDLIDIEKNKEYGIDLNRISKKSKIKIWVGCNNIEYHPSYLISAKNFVNGIGCPYCKGSKVCLEDSVGYKYPKIKEIWSTKNEKTPYQYTVGNNTDKVIFKCNKCGKEYLRTIYTEIRQMFRCPHCSNTTNGEEMVSSVLDKCNIDYLQQYRFKDCKYKNTLAFDFYIPNKNTCIEYDGEQHFRPVKFNGISQDRAEQIFAVNKIRDEIKTTYCNKNGIRLIRIPYWEFENIENILIKELNLIN